MESKSSLLGNRIGVLGKGGSGKSTFVVLNKIRDDQEREFLLEWRYHPSSRKLMNYPG